MTIAVQCRRCDRTLKVKDEFSGRSVKCPHCQTQLKVPVAEDEFGIVDEEVAPQPSKSKRKSAPSGQPLWVSYLKSYWYLFTPVLSLVIGIFTGIAGIMIGLGMILWGVLLAVIGFLAAVLVDPVYALVPLARMSRSDAERQRIWKKQSPHFGRFGKGLIIVALGGLSAYIGLTAQDRLQRAKLKERVSAELRIGKPEISGNLPQGTPAFPPEQSNAAGVSPQPVGSMAVASQPVSPAPGDPSSPFVETPGTPGTTNTPDAAQTAAESSGILATFADDQCEVFFLMDSGQTEQGKPLKLYQNQTVLLERGDRSRIIRPIYQIRANINVDAGKSVAVPVGLPPTPSSTAKGDTSQPYIMSPMDGDSNIKANQKIFDELHGRYREGDFIEVEVVGSQLGNCVGGNDEVYASMSRVEVAAVHSGLLKVGERGRLRVTFQNPRSNYRGSKQNGIQTVDWPPSVEGYKLSKAK